MDFGVEDLDKDPIFQSLGDISQMFPDPSVNEDRQDSRAGGTPAAQSQMAPVDEKEVAAKKLHLPMLVSIIRVISTCFLLCLLIFCFFRCPVKGSAQKSTCCL